MFTYYLTYYVSPYGQVSIPDPVRRDAFERAFRRHPESAIKVSEYASKLIARWATGTAYFLWKHR